MNIEEVKRLVVNGEYYASMSRILGVPYNTIRHFCLRHGIELTEDGKAKAHDAGHAGRSYCDDVRGISVDEQVKANSISFIYISGYTNCDSKIEVECTVCKRRSIISYQTIRKATNPVRCRLCEADRVAEKRAQENRAKAEKEEQKRLEREEREAKRAEWLKARWHACPVCGKQTTRPKYCSDDCQHKAMNRLHEHRRRIKIKAAIVDADISLEEVYRRDKGVCHICGMACDWNDHEWRGKTFITGRLYPTIDHVIPLARGGTHGWDNVRLAHLCCNSMKGAKLA